jgi:hypothetical protein
LNVQRPSTFRRCFASTAQGFGCVYWSFCNIRHRYQASAMRQAFVGWRAGVESSCQCHRSPEPAVRSHCRKSKGGFPLRATVQPKHHY